MKSELLAKSPMLALPLGALFFFLFVFCVVVFVAMRRKTYATEAALALEGDEAAPPKTTHETTTTTPEIGR